MNNVQILCFIFVLTTVLGCGTNRPETLVDTKLNEIILVDAAGSRCEVGEMINLISKSNPKVIGVNFLYIEERDHHCDSTLRQAISQSGKVVLIEGFKNEKHVESHRIFLDVAMLSGLTGLSQSDSGVIDSYYRIVDHRGRWEYSFPFHLALQYDLERDSELAVKSRPKDYPIVFYHSFDDFKVVDGLEGIKKESGVFGDKIVIIGAMTRANDNICSTPVTPKSSDKTYGTVVIANVLLDILQDLNTPPVKANKYSEFILEQNKKKIR